ncbi:DUF72 domain-containing protein [Candidatus Nitrosocosmicus franklandus]|uniref:DUF72 domain-containing protein n=1 Tax=Candidatus Nitrosocosmicus franklandianus TaxID=1798806 RepID=A0A484IED0_9ARCH|nr:DUF72 domain-containing protein [Candidatus Nitrosocosmicus franklandus]VFJ15177.1 conserved protein of unknown function [Candidatus Nitrosocosmicus franklandus]
MALNIGCSGWSYEGWKGKFYPREMENKDYLSYYSKLFKFVEVDSTYYHIPSRTTVRGWKDKTPDDFRFSLKFPKVITHEKKLEDVVKPLSILFYSLEPLIDKTLTLLIQLPHFLTERNGFTPLKDMVHHLDKRFRYSIEVRHPSWFTEEVYEFLKYNDISLVWSIRDELVSPSIVTSDHVYIRFIGDRSISEKDFGKIVKDRRKDLLEYVKQVREIQNENSDIQDILIAFNNHFAGFGPQSVNDFLRLMSMSEIDWKAEMERYKNNNNTNQSTLSGF